LEACLEIIILIFAGLLGAIVGSFLNVVILRLPQEGSSIVFPGSHCPQCNTPLQWFENIPIISYLVLRGKCRTCQVKISPQYPMVEACMALLSMALMVLFGISFDFFYYFIFAAALLVIIFIDIRHQIIPDVISLPGIGIGFLGSFVALNVTWTASAIGILAGGGILYAIALVYYVLTKRDGMGGGDIKLLAMLGAFLGWQSLLYIVFFSSLTGSIVGVAAMIRQKSGAKTRIPFGPFLALGGLTYLFFNAYIMQIWQWYISLLR
jgi:leader peptidase (prepilin peptidase)/N-methyltransferase